MSTSLAQHMPRVAPSHHPELLKAAAVELVLAAADEHAKSTRGFHRALHAAHKHGLSAQRLSELTGIEVRQVGKILKAVDVSTSGDASGDATTSVTTG